ncbi:MAG: hypothetical protein ACE5PM_04850 [Candidatus Hydrothermarchaeales archaeon]
MKIAIPGHVTNITPEEEERLLDLFRRYGNARRRAYNLQRKGAGKAGIESLLQHEQGLNSRYAKDALYSVKDLPSRWTSGGKKNQRLREKDRITREEYTQRRNSLILSRGDKTKKGNLNTRLIKTKQGWELRISVPPREGERSRWIYPEIFIPRKYLKKYRRLLDGSLPYTVYIKRKDNGRGYGLRIVVETPDDEYETLERVMTLDVNAGHIDFAIAERDRVLAVGKVGCHEVQHAGTGKTEYLLHKVAGKIGNIAKHYKAKVVLGKLNTARYRGRGARKIKGIPHYRLAHILGYKLEAVKKSEAYTTKMAGKIAPRAGLDVHKVSAALFALKVLDYDSWSSLKDELLPRGVRADEGAGSPSAGLNAGSGLTVPCQAFDGGNAVLNGLAGDEATSQSVCDGGYTPIPGRGGLSSFLESLENNLLCLHPKLY